MTNQIPPLTTKQQEILKLIYRYRFLNRVQIQALLKHKNKRRIISWLKDLRDKQYVDWHYDPNDFIAKSQPGIYYLGLSGIRHLRTQDTYPNEELRKRYEGPTRTQSFMDRCLLRYPSSPNGNDISYRYITEADYTIQNHSDHSLNEPKPHLFFTKHQNEIAVNYLLEVFDATLPRYQLRSRYQYDQLPQAMISL